MGKKKEEYNKTAVLRVQLSVVVKYNEKEDIGRIIEESDFYAENKEANFLSVRPLNYQVINNKRIE